MANICLDLYKESFKFSAAHFLIFDEIRAERLHGHNYQVRIKIKGSAENNPAMDKGFLIDFIEIKNFAQELINTWDERVILPGLHADIKTQIKGDSLELRFRDRFYVFPKNEVLVLPMRNASVEEFARLLSEALVKQFASK